MDGIRLDYDDDEGDFSERKRERERKNMVSNSVLPPIYTNVTNLSTKETIFSRKRHQFTKL